VSLWERKTGPAPQVPIIVSERLRCIACGSSGPFASCLVLRDYAIRDGKLVSEHSGDRVACQRCSAQFSLHQDGSFQHHPLAEPYTGSARPTNQATTQQFEQPQGPTEPPRAPWPEARKPPPV